MRNVLASAVESELVALFYNGRETSIIRQSLLEMKHLQSSISIKTDNPTVDVIVNRSVIRRKT